MVSRNFCGTKNEREEYCIFSAIAQFLQNQMESIRLSTYIIRFMPYPSIMHSTTYFTKEDRLAFAEFNEK